MRHISFMLTEQQVRARTKTVTRRLGWVQARVGQELMGVNKCQGLKPGEKQIPLAHIRITGIRREQLDALTGDPQYGREEMSKEGFPEMTPDEFVKMFCKHMHPCRPDWLVTRIEFEYLN